VVVKTRPNIVSAEITLHFTFRARSTVAAIVALTLSACGSTPPLGGNPGLSVLDSGVLPPPTRADMVSADRPYLIGPFDKLTIDVFGVPDLSKEVQADASGRISLPLAGVVEAAGKTPEELGRSLEALLRGKFVRDPQVTVNLKETVSQVVTVDGEVKEPGLYPVVGRMTLMKAVATAKGTGEFASLNNVVIFRTVGGKRLAALYNLKSIRRGVYDDPEIFANDVVVVGDSAARRIFRDVLALAPAITTPLVYVLTR
jgi:polysaccharide biosynthesis/export protein